MIKHFVTFYNPGTFVSEQTEKEIDYWDVQTAIKMSNDIKERHNARPYGFRFSTRERLENELDSKVTKTSNMYYLGGAIFTLQDIIDKNDPKDRILIQNMKNNDIDKIIINDNSWRFTGPFYEDDVLIEV